MIRKCAECGKEFYCSPTDKTVTCSKECSKSRRSRLLNGKEFTQERRDKISAAAKKLGWSDNLQKGTSAAQKSPKAGRFVTNSSAKRWHLVSPDGKSYKCTNLCEFARKNAHLFEINGEDDKQVDRVCKSFIKLKRGIKNGTRSTCNKGWTIRIGYDDKKKLRTIIE